uniref:Histone H2A n=1 Tax=Catagonus wagneri TaxID=51154 RepID=A0A8C3X0Y6_9CETA
KFKKSQCRPKKHAVSRSSRAELQFPVSRVDRVLRESDYARRLSSYTPVFLAGVLEYLTANILDLAGREASSSHRVRIAPEHVQRMKPLNLFLIIYLIEEPELSVSICFKMCKSILYKLSQVMDSEVCTIPLNILM